MAKRSIARLYDTSDHARMVVSDLEAAGFLHDDVSYLGGQGATHAGTTTADDTAADTGAATGATLGTVLGGGAGLLAGIGALAIPGVGPVVAAGWLIATLTGAGAGAAAGGLLGALGGAGISDDDATSYSEGVRRGGHLVVVRADESRAIEAERIMDRHNPVDMQSRQNEWRNDGWPGNGTTHAGLAGGTTAATTSSVARPSLTDTDLPLTANDPTFRRLGGVA